MERQAMLEVFTLTAICRNVPEAISVRTTPAPLGGVIISHPNLISPKHHVA